MSHRVNFAVNDVVVLDPSLGLGQDEFVVIGVEEKKANPDYDPAYDDDVIVNLHCHNADSIKRHTENMQEGHQLLALAERSSKLVLVYKDGNRQEINGCWASKVG